MDLSFMQNDMVLALCWTLIHSLWQGLLLAIVTGVVMIATRKSNAGQRYKVLTFLFFLFMIGVVITFVKEMRSAPASGSSVAITHPVGQGNLLLTEAGLIKTNTAVPVISLLEKFKEYFNTHASLIVMIWFVIFIARFIRFTANVAYVQRLKYYKTYAPSKQWKDKISELMEKLGIRKQIELLESGVVKIPLVMGVLKPVILLPMGLLTTLPVEEIEAILLHELAHIQRRDYFINLLQSFAETLFFFNPALMWLSSVIREERENCCDDIAISVTNNKTKFINALILFQEYNFSKTSFEVGFPGKKNQLLNRVKRIINERNKTLNAAEKSVLTFGMGVLILFSFAATKKADPVITKPSSLKINLIDPSQEKESIKQTYAATASLEQHMPVERETIVSSMTVASYAPVLHESIDTVPGKKIAEPAGGKIVFGGDKVEDGYTSISISTNEDDHGKLVTMNATRKDGKTIKFVKTNNVLTELYINNEKIAEKDFANYAADINQLEMVSAERKERSKAAHLLSEADRIRNADAKKRDMIVRQQLQREKDLHDIVRISGETASKRLMIDKIKSFDDSIYQLKREILKVKTKRDTYKKEEWDTAVSYEKRKTLQLSNKMLLINSVKLKDSLKRANSIIVNDKAIQKKKDFIRERHAEDEERFQQSAQKIRSIIAELEKDGIKIDMQKSWIALDNGQFVVDGKKMTPEQHQRFKEKYIDTNGHGWGYYYGSIQGTGRGVFLDYKDLSR